MIWIKILHIAAISIWSATLICLPGLHVRRAHMKDKEALHRLQAVVRFLYVGIMSPAAFVGIASGTALIFAREAFEPWFAVKLVLVGGMTTIHVLTGLVVIRLFDKGEVYPIWRFVAVTTLTGVVVLAILFVVLVKPELPQAKGLMSEPGGLGRLLGGIIPVPRS